MAKGKRELIVEIGGDQLHLVEFKKLLEGNLKAAGIKYSDNVKMYFKCFVFKYPHASIFSCKCCLLVLISFTEV